MAFKLSWHRPADIPYPITWATFKGKDRKGGELVEYEIRDVTPDRFDEVYHLMSTVYLRDEPLNQYLGCVKEPGIGSRFRAFCLSAMGQRTPIACFKKSTDEVVGANIVTVYSKIDNMADQFKEFPKAETERKTYETLALLYADFDVYEHYNVDKYISCCGLTVADDYRGCGIGLELLRARKKMGQMFNIAISHSDFTSNFSNALADRIGFVVDREFRYSQLREIDPKFDFTNIPHARMTSMTWVLNKDDG